jgi:hypothetical protein
MDQNNFNRIHTSVRRILIYKYAKELSEDQVYSIIVKKKSVFY